jgi:2-hydroxy-6-oxonona-2,4-dienedioate hydrolase
MELEHKRTNINGLQVFSRISVHDQQSARQPIVLVHGLSVSSLYLVPTAENLALDYSVYVPDFPGFGKSDKPKHILDLAELVDSLAEWMDHFSIAQAILLGNSMGCQIIAEFALRNPGRVSKAILVGPTTDPKRRTFFHHMILLLVAGFIEPPRYIPVVIKDYLRAGLRRTVRTSRYILRDRIEEKLPQMTSPVLVVRGERDPIVSQEWVESIHRLLPDSKLVVIPGAAHVVNFSHPVELANAVRSFLDESSG